MVNKASPPHRWLNRRGAGLYTLLKESCAIAKGESRHNFYLPALTSEAEDASRKILKISNPVFKGVVAQMPQTLTCARP
ncbi:MAG: hypothetical protein ACKOB7_08925, partial [Methylocystis sp.]